MVIEANHGMKTLAYSKKIVCAVNHKTRVSSLLDFQSQSSNFAEILRQKIMFWKF